MPYADKAAQKAYVHAHYLRNKDAYCVRARAHNSKTKRANAKLVRAFLEKHPCVDCGEADPVVLEFDHVRGEKRAAVGSLLKDGCAWSTLQIEIAKCDVRCANCHRRKTVKERGSVWLSQV